MLVSVAIIAVLLLSLFLCGVLVGRFELPPFRLLAYVHSLFPPLFQIQDRDTGSQFKISSRVLHTLNDNSAANIHMIGTKGAYSGNCICIDVTTGPTIVVDVGKKRATASILSYLQNAGIDRIDRLIITHQHSDHTGGLSAFINSVDVQQIVLPHTTPDEKIEDLVVDRVPYTQAYPGDETELGDAKIQFLGPIRRYDSRENNNSIVCKITVAGVDIVLTGDTEKPAEREIVETYTNSELQCDLLQVAHHGQLTSSTPEFVSATDPDYALIFSDGCLPNSHPDVIARLITVSGTTVHDTAAHGSVVYQITTDGEIITKTG